MSSKRSIADGPERYMSIQDQLADNITRVQTTIAEAAKHAGRHAEAHGIRLPVLLQVNVAGETSKEGMSIAKTSEVARQIAALFALKVEGLMTIAPLVDDPEKVRPVFRGLRVLREQLQQELPQC